MKLLEQIILSLRNTSCANSVCKRGGFVSAYSAIHVFNQEQSRREASVPGLHRSLSLIVLSSTGLLSWVLIKARELRSDLLPLPYHKGSS